jgi:STIP1 family protein 1
VKTAEAFPFIPSQYMCPISFNWMEDPVVTPSGISYDRTILEEWLINNPHDSSTQEALSIDQVYANRNLKDAIEYYKNTYVHFSIPLIN